MSSVDIIRAWKDEGYRKSLSPEQQAQLPENPAHNIELNDADLDQMQGGGALTTDTLSLPCPTALFCTPTTDFACRLTLYTVCS